MKDYGFLRVAAAVPVVRVASVKHNVKEICRLAEEAESKEASVVVFPELSVTGSTCGDLFHNTLLADEAEKGICSIAGFSRGKNTVIVAGAPVPYNGRLYDCAVVIRDGEVAGIVPRTDVRSLSRRFASGEGLDEETTVRYAGQDCPFSPYLLFPLGKAMLGVAVGNDGFMPGATLILNPTAENELVMSDRRRRIRLEGLTRQGICSCVSVNAGFGESTRDMAFAGAASIWENGTLLKENERFRTDGSLTVADVDMETLDLLRRKAQAPLDYVTYATVELGEPADTDFEKELCREIVRNPFLPDGDEAYRCREVISLQVSALMTRLGHIGCRTAVIGISGGLDSTLALLVTTLAFDGLGWSRDRIIGVTMPGFGTTSRTKNNAWDLMLALGTSCREISIKAACGQHFSDIGHDASVHDATYENSQARERTQILMDLANKEGGIVIGTGDLSELALGWATYNGDHMSMYGVNADVPKTLVKSLVKWAAENMFAESHGERTVKDILLDIVDTPISPELLPAADDGKINQVTEDLVGPYELHDFFLYHFAGRGTSPDKIYFLACKAFKGAYDGQVIMKWLRTFIRRFFNQQFKRSCMPDGPKVGSVGLSPRGDWDMPSDSWSATFLESLD